MLSPLSWFKNTLFLPSENEILEVKITAGALTFQVEDRKSQLFCLFYWSSCSNCSCRCSSCCCFFIFIHFYALASPCILSYTQSMGLYCQPFRQLVLFANTLSFWPHRKYKEWWSETKRSDPLDFESHRKTYKYLLLASSSPTVYALMLSKMPK